MIENIDSATEHSFSRASFNRTAAPFFIFVHPAKKQKKRREENHAVQRFVVILIILCCRRSVVSLIQRAQLHFHWIHLTGIQYAK